VYAFALCAYFILHGEPLFDENNELAYDNNTAKNEKGNETWELLKAAINSCLQVTRMTDLISLRLREKLSSFYWKVSAKNSPSRLMRRQ
jgi:hypothetical protein